MHGARKLAQRLCCWSRNRQLIPETDLRFARPRVVTPRRGQNCAPCMVRSRGKAKMPEPKVTSCSRNEKDRRKTNKRRECLKPEGHIGRFVSGSSKANGRQSRSFDLRGLMTGAAAENSGEQIREDFVWLVDRATELGDKLRIRASTRCIPNVSGDREPCTQQLLS